jgi:hypothetical protein
MSGWLETGGTADVMAPVPDFAAAVAVAGWPAEFVLSLLPLC